LIKNLGQIDPTFQILESTQVVCMLEQGDVNEESV